MSHREQRLAAGLAALLLLAPLTAFGQSGTGRDSIDDVPEGRDIIRKGGGKRTRKQKREAKQMAQEQADARKEQRKWEKMGLAARTSPEWYAEALSRYKDGKYLQAREILLPLEDSPRALEIQDKVKLLVADTYYYQGGTLNLAEALARYRSYLTFYPTSEHAEYARYQMGNCYYKQLGPPDRDQSYTDNAIAEYSALLRDFPRGEYAEQAQERVLEARALRARHEFDVARFYWAWGNYPAASQRSMELLRERPESPDREEALYLAAQSLYNVGRVTEAESWAARLREDHPDSKWTSRLKPTSSGKAAAQVERKAKKRERDQARTYKAQRRREDRRTRQVRKDSGLPGRVPGSSAEVRQDEPKRSAAAKDAADEGSTSHAKRMEKLEAEEMAKARKDEEREAERRARAQARAAAEAKPKTEKELAREAKRAAAQAADEQKREKRMERLEAQEQAEAEKQAVRDEKAAAERAEKDRKEAEKKARKAKKKGE